MIKTRKLLSFKSSTYAKKIIPLMIFIFAKGKCLNVWEGKVETEEKRSNRGNTMFEIIIKNVNS